MSLALLGLLGFVVAGCTKTKTVTRTVTLAKVPYQTADHGRGEPEPLKVSPAIGISCGVELWPIKTLTDSNAAAVQLDPVLPTSISAINALPPPSDPTTRQGDNFELHSYRVTADVVGYKLEADNDWHIVLSDDGSETTGHTMIVEIPNPACAQPPLEPTSSRVLAQIIEARAAFETAFPPANACFSCGLKQQVTVVGVGFFDKLHGQHGVAINGAELHPVIGFLVGGGPAPPTTTGTSTVESTTAVAPVAVPTPPPASRHGTGCNRYPGRHWFKHRYHKNCRPSFFFTRYGAT